MASGLKKWFAQKWVDIGSKRKDGSFAKCGRSKQKKDAVKRKRSKAQGVGGKPTNVKTILKKNMGGIISDQRRAGVAQRGFGFKGIF